MERRVCQSRAIQWIEIPSVSAAAQVTIDQHLRIVEIPQPPVHRGIEGGEGEAHAAALEIRVVEPLSPEVCELLGDRGERSFGRVHRSVEIGIVVPPGALQLTRDPQRMPTSRRLCRRIPGEDAPETAQA
jgi:hypothetical protein